MDRARRRCGLRGRGPPVAIRLVRSAAQCDPDPMENPMQDASAPASDLSTHGQVVVDIETMRLREKWREDKRRQRGAGGRRTRSRSRPLGREDRASVEELASPPVSDSMELHMSDSDARFAPARVSALFASDSPPPAPSWTADQITGTLGASILPGLSFAFAHYVAPRYPVMWCLVGFCLLFSAPSVYSWARRWTGHWAKALGFALALETAMAQPFHVPVVTDTASACCLAALVIVNCVAAWRKVGEADRADWAIRHQHRTAPQRFGGPDQAGGAT